MATKRTRQPITVADLTQAIDHATHHGGAYGGNLSVGRELRARRSTDRGGPTYPVTRVTVAHDAGQIVLLVEYDDTPPPGSDR